MGSEPKQEMRGWLRLRSLAEGDEESLSALARLEERPRVVLTADMTAPTLNPQRNIYVDTCSSEQKVLLLERCHEWDQQVDRFEALEALADAPTIAALAAENPELMRQIEEGGEAFEATLLALSTTRAIGMEPAAALDPALHDALGRVRQTLLEDEDGMRDEEVALIDEELPPGPIPEEEGAALWFRVHQALSDAVDDAPPLDAVSDWSTADLRSVLVWLELVDLADERGHEAPDPPSCLCDFWDALLAKRAEEAERARVASLRVSLESCSLVEGIDEALSQAMRYCVRARVLALVERNAEGAQELLVLAHAFADRACELGIYRGIVPGMLASVCSRIEALERVLGYVDSWG